VDEFFRRLKIQQAHLREQLELSSEKISKLIERRKLLLKALLIERQRMFGLFMCSCGIFATFCTVIMMLKLAEPVEVFFEYLPYIIISFVLSLVLVFVGGWLSERKPTDINGK
jgi:fluoride ion exporter CrcB/FEX